MSVMMRYDDTPHYAMVFPSVGRGQRSVKTPGGSAAAQQQKPYGEL